MIFIYSSSRNRKRPNILVILVILVSTIYVTTAVFTNAENQEGAIRLLIQWKVKEDENDGAEKAGQVSGLIKKRFSDILKSKESQMKSLLSSNLGFTMQDTTKEEEIDDSGVEVTVDIPEYGVTAVTGPTSYFQDINLTNHVAVKRVEEDFVRRTGYNDGTGVFTLASNFTAASETVPYGIPITQSMLIPTSDNIMKMCIIDTGYDIYHPDLPSYFNGYHHVEGIPDESYDEGWYNDYMGHGTHVAGIVAAIHNTQGVVGVNGDPTKIRLVIGKGLKRDGSGFISTILHCIKKCAERKVNVINMSFGGEGRSLIEEDIFKKLYNDGLLLVAAAGNTGQTVGVYTDFYPAMFPSVISVASTTQTRTRSDFSLINSQVEIAAPGSDIYSTLPYQSYGFSSGTSMAAPYVAGVLLKVWAHFPECSNFQLRQAMLKTASNYHTCNNHVGHGDIQAKALYDNLKQFGCDFGGSASQWTSKNNINRANGAMGGCTESWVPAFATKPPTNFPTSFPTSSPTKSPTSFPTSFPTKFPTNFPTSSPTKFPTGFPTSFPTKIPTKFPTNSPTISEAPSTNPSLSDTPSISHFPTTRKHFMRQKKIARQKKKQRKKALRKKRNRQRAKLKLNKKPKAQERNV